MKILKHILTCIIFPRDFDNYICTHTSLRNSEANNSGKNFTIADPPLIMATCALVAMDPKILEPFPSIARWFENFQKKHPQLWAIAKEGLDGLSYYDKNPRDMSHLKHPIHPVRKEN